MKAIETLYKGHRFRSRLEARWAVFFDTLGVQWSYEPEGFEREEFVHSFDAQGNDVFNKVVHRYLPDFRVTLGGASYWCEVKGDPKWLRENRDSIESMHDYGGILPNFAGSAERCNSEGGIILLGEVPAPSSAIIFVPVLCHRKGLLVRWLAFSGTKETGLNLSRIDDVFLFQIGFNAALHFSDLEKAKYDFQPRTVPMRFGWPWVNSGLVAARSARFEHGEAP